MLRRLGRAAMGGMFIQGGWSAYASPEPLATRVAGTGLPVSAALVRFNGAAMMAGGAALAVGILPRAAATGLTASLAATTVAGHPFWREEDPEQRRRQLTQFLKNAAALGGLLVYLSIPPG